MQSHKERAEKLERLLEVDPSNPQLMSELADLYCRGGDQALALAWYTRLQALQGESPQSLNRMASLHLAAGRYSVAADLLARAITLAPGAAALHFNKAYADFAAGRLDEAISSTMRATDLDATNPLAMHSHAEALAQLRTAVTLEPNSEQGQLSLGLACVLNEDAQGAQAAFDTVLRINSENADAWVGLAVLRAGEDMSAAQRCLDHALRADPESASARWLQAGFAGLRENDVERRCWLRRFEQTHSFGPSGWMNRELLVRAQRSNRRSLGSAHARDAVRRHARPGLPPSP
jgi:tetratricopeptide (TPR) repeat protein